MARCSVTQIGAGAGSTTLPSTSLYAVANFDLVAREAGAFNTTTTAARMEAVRLNSAGTQGAGLTEANIFPATHTIQGTGFAAHSSTGPTLGAIVGPMPLGAAVGAGTILTWYGEGNGIHIPAGTANGLGIMTASGTGQISDDYIIWDE